MPHYLSSSHIALLLISTVIWVSGNGLIPLLPVYAASLGADNADIGMYLAFSYTCLAMGALCSSRFTASRNSSLIVLMATGLMSIPLTLSVGYVSNLTQLTLSTSVIWFLGGAGFSSLNVLYARIGATQDSGNSAVKYRGKLMGLLAATSPLGSVLGGLFSGPIVDYWGFSQLFLALALLNLVWPMATAYLLLSSSSPRAKRNDGFDKPSSGSVIPLSTDPVQIKTNHRKLIVANTFSYFSYYMALLAVSVLMKDAGYSATAIASTAIVGGLVSLPLVFGLVHASDYLGRRKAWLFSNVIGALSISCLIFASSLYHFWFVAVMTRCLSAGSRGIGSAWAIDLTDDKSHSNDAQTPDSQEMLIDVHFELSDDEISRQEALNKTLSILSSTPWIGGVLGYLSFGLLSESFSNDAAIIAAMLIPLLSVIAVLSIETSTYIKTSPYIKTKPFKEMTLTNSTKENTEVPHDRSF